MLITLVASTGVYLLGRPLLGIFTENQAIITIAMGALLVDVLLEQGRATVLLFLFCLRSVGDVVVPVILYVVLCRVLRVYVRYRVRIRLSGDVVRFCFGRVFQGSGTLFAVANAEVEKEDVNQESC